MKTGKELYVVEPRNPDGSLNAKTEDWPPFKASGVTEREIYNYYFSNNPTRQSATQIEINEYFNSRGWYIREKTW